MLQRSSSDLGLVPTPSRGSCARGRCGSSAWKTRHLWSRRLRPVGFRPPSEMPSHYETEGAPSTDVNPVIGSSLTTSSATAMEDPTIRTISRHFAGTTTTWRSIRRGTTSIPPLPVTADDSTGRRGFHGGTRRDLTLHDARPISPVLAAVHDLPDSDLYSRRPRATGAYVRVFSSRAASCGGVRCSETWEGTHRWKRAMSPGMASRDRRWPGSPRRW